MRYQREIEVAEKGNKTKNKTQTNKKKRWIEVISKVERDKEAKKKKKM